MNRTNEIETVAAELGYTEAAGVSALDYIIETAKASVMVNQQNVELMAQVEFLRGVMQSMADSHVEDGEIEAADQFLIHLKPTPTQCLNQIRAEAGKTGFIAGYHRRSVERMTRGADKQAEIYVSSLYGD